LVYVKLEGIDSRNDADAIRGKELMLPEAAELDHDSFYLHDVIGMRVVDESGAPLGQLVDVLSTGSNDVYVVRGERGELLLPAIEDVVKQMDVRGRRMVIEMVEGLEFHSPARPRARRTKAKTPPEK